MNREAQAGGPAAPLLHSPGLLWDKFQILLHCQLTVTMDNAHPLSGPVSTLKKEEFEPGDQNLSDRKD